MAQVRFTCEHRHESIQPLLVSPLASGIKDFTKLVDYFEYSAPGIDSIHAKQISDLNHETVIKKMLRIAGMKRYKFLQKPQQKTFANYDLYGENLCIKCQRMVCQKFSNETDYQALIRHIRNGLAHGRIYVKKTKNQIYLFIEDFDSKRKNITARIIITRRTLEKWKEHLEEL